METSTRIVRHHARGKALALMGAVVRGAGRVAPAAAGRWAAARFLTPRSRLPRPEEQAILARASHEMRQLGRRSVSAYTWGTGPIALLVHGWGGHAGNMTAFVGPLCEAGYQVVALEAPAHGRSPGRITHVPEMGDVVRGFAEALGGVEAIVCHSAGATATGLAVREGLRARRIVMVAPALAPGLWAHAFADALRLQGPLRQCYIEALEDHGGAPLSSTSLETTGPHIRCPVLVMHDEDDRMVLPRDVDRIAAALPDVCTSASRGLGHHRILHDTSRVAAGIRFLRSSASRSRRAHGSP